MSTSEPRTTRTPALDWQVAPEKEQIVALVPAFNEARFIGSVVLAARRYVDLVVVIDDGSSDDTVAIASDAGAIVVRHSSNRGKAAAVNTGFTYLREYAPRVVVMLDGDGQHRASDIPVMIAPIIEERADIVIGSRFLSIVSAIPAYRQMGQHGLTAITNVASGVTVTDSQCGYRAFSSEAINTLHFRAAGFSIESEIQFMAREHGLRLAEAPVGVIYAEKAKRNPIKHGLQVVDGVLYLMGQVRPLLFFGVAGGLLLLAALAIGMLVVDTYSRTQQLAVGQALITVLVGALGVVVAFAGVILHSVRGMFSDLQKLLLGRARAYDRSVVPPVPRRRSGTPAQDS